MKEKVYKPEGFSRTNMLPGDLKRSPDDYFSENTLVFVDAGFLSKLSKYFGNGKYLSYDVIRFSENLSKKENLNCIKIFYYTAPPFQSERPEKNEKLRKDNYDRFINKLKQQNDFIIREGRCQRIRVSSDDFKFCQKGVDTLMTMDLVSIPIKFPKIKRIILIACDSDFVPVINQLREFNLEIILYTYFTKRRNTNFSRSFHLINSVSRYVKLTKQDFLEAGFEK